MQGYLKSLQISYFMERNHLVKKDFQVSGWEWDTYYTFVNRKLSRGSDQERRLTCKVNKE